MDYATEFPAWVAGHIQYGAWAMVTTIVESLGHALPWVITVAVLFLGIKVFRGIAHI